MKIRYLLILLDQTQFYIVSLSSQTTPHSRLSNLPFHLPFPPHYDDCISNFHHHRDQSKHYTLPLLIISPSSHLPL